MKELEFLFELSERRFDVTSTILCTLYRQDESVKRLGKGTFAESLEERYHHNTYVIESGEMNMRKKSLPEIKNLHGVSWCSTVDCAGLNRGLVAIICISPGVFPTQ